MWFQLIENQNWYIQQVYQMNYLGLSQANEGTLAFLKRDKSKDLALQRKKSYSIKPTKHFSPQKAVDNPQDRKSKQQIDQSKWSNRILKSLTDAIRQPSQSLIGAKINQKYPKAIGHNKSVNNLRTTFSPIPLAKTEKKIFGKSKDKTIGQSLKREKKIRIEQKKCKQAPSFIKNKSNHGPTLQDFKIIKTLKEKEEYRQLIVVHKKTKGLFALKAYKKSLLLREKQLYQQIKFYIKNIEINHNLIIKCFGYFSDTENFYLIQQFLAGETIAQHLAMKRQPFSQHQIGSKICQILTAITYLNSIHFSYGNISQSNIIHSLNICKLKRPYLIFQRKDILFDVWCLGKLTFEMITSCILVDEAMLQGCRNIQDLFSSSQIVMALEVAFKRFQAISISRELIKFLITTLWQIQNQKLTLQQIWQLDFVKLYKEDDIWRTHTQK